MLKECSNFVALWLVASQVLCYGATFVYASEFPPSFDGSMWIWTSEGTNPPSNMPVGNRFFRNTINSSNAVSVDVLITADDEFDFYVDGHLVGSSPHTGQASLWNVARRFHATLDSSAKSHMFAVRVTNQADINLGGETAAGFLAAIIVTHTDGSMETVRTDGSWTATTSSDFAGFEDPGKVTDSSWGSVKVVAKYGGAPWNVALSVPEELSFASSTWIWAAEASSYTPPDAPAGDRAFRMARGSPSGLSAAWASVLMTADNNFALYVNGQAVGVGINSTSLGEGWQTATRFDGIALSPSSNLFSILATNLAGSGAGGSSSAGLLVTVQILYSDGSTELLRSSNELWLASTHDDNFAQGTVDSSLWSKAIGVGAYPTSPWGVISQTRLQNVAATSSNTTPVSNTAAISPTSSSSSVSVDKGKSSSNTGAIAGGVIAGVAALAALFAVLFYLRRRRQATQESATITTFSLPPPEQSDQGEFPVFHYHSPDVY